MLNCFEHFQIYILGENDSKIREEKLSKKIYKVLLC